MRTTIVYDCEYLTNRTAPERYWCGPSDPDPTVVQIGAVRLGLEGDVPILDTFDALVRPRDRGGCAAPIDPYLTWLTGITAERLDENGVPLGEALDRFAAFADGTRCWSWGKDELNLMAISCYVEGIAPPMAANRFGNAAALLLEAGMDPEDVGRARSNTLAAMLGAEHPQLRAHDALDDALSVAYALKHLLGAGRLRPEHFMA